MGRPPGRLVPSLRIPRCASRRALGRILPVLLLGAILAGCTKKTTVLQPVNAGRGAISGIAYTFQRPAAGVTITTDPGNVVVSTASDGTFRINDLPAPVVYRLTATGFGFVGASQLVALSEGQAATVYFYLASTETLRVVRSSTAAAGTTDIAVRDSLAYLATESALEVRDLHGATFGRLVGRLPIASSYYRTLALGPSHVYYSTYTSDLLVVDVSNPAAPQYVRTLPVTQAHDAEIDGNLLVVAADDSLLFFSLADPADPVRIGGVPTEQDGSGQGDYGVALDRQRKVAIVCSFNNGIEIVRYSNPTAPVYVTQLASSYNPWDADVDETLARAYIAGDNGIQILDYADPQNAQIVGEIAPGGNGGRDVRHYNGFLAFASTFNGMSFIDVRNPETPLVLHRLYGTSIGLPSGIARDGARIYVAAGTRLLAVDFPPPVIVPASGRPGAIARPAVTAKALVHRSRPHPAR